MNLPLNAWQVLLAAVALDLAVGDPRHLPHPVRWLGRLAGGAEHFCRASLGGSRLAGTLAALLVLTTGLLSCWLFMTLAAALHPWAGAAACVLLVHVSIALRDLLVHARAVERGLARDLRAGQGAVAMLVGRDTAALDQAGVCRACVESVAENLVDGFCAPLFWAMAGGLAAGPAGAALAAAAFRIINTLDAMWGHRNERYARFGTLAARLDDAAGFLPARLCGLVLVLAAGACGLDMAGAWRVLRRDRLAHSSPNSAHAEAPAAGALGVRLGGPTAYQGHMRDNPWLGRKGRDPNPADIARACRLVLAAGLAWTLLMAAVLALAGPG